MKNMHHKMYENAQSGFGWLEKVQIFKKKLVFSKIEELR